MFETAVLVLVRGNEVLLQLRDDKPTIYQPNCWTIPGGSLKKGEPPYQALRREIKEETGYRCRAPKLLKTISYTRVDTGEKGRWHVFVEKYNGEPIYCFEGQKMEFKDLSELDELELIADLPKGLVAQAVREYQQ